MSIGAHRGWLGAAPLPNQNALVLEVSAELLPVLVLLLPRVRRLFDLDANPQVIEAHFLRRDTRLKPIVRRQTGLRVPGAFEGFEFGAARGQQISVKAASTLFGRLAAAIGTPALTSHAGLTYFAPTAAQIADADAGKLVGLGLTRKRADTVRLARAVADGGLKLEWGVPVEETMAGLQGGPGIGAWTAHYIAMRALGFTDAFPHRDLGLMKALVLRRSRDILAVAEPWRPWRSYAAFHLWANLNRPLGLATMVRRQL